MILSSQNILQARAIRRYHRHLNRQCGPISVEMAARRWVARYASHWRRHFALSHRCVY